MSSSPSAPPPGVPRSDNAKYAVLAILLVLGAGGMFVWRGMSQPGPQSPVVLMPSATTSATAATTNSKLDDIPPAPTEEVKPEAGPTKIVYVSAGGCDKTCTGSATNDLTGALNVRGNQARRCYMQALASDPSLKGHVSISVKIGPAGNACSAGVASNDMGNAYVANCAANIFRNASYPPPRGGCIDVSVPLSFVAQGQ